MKERARPFRGITSDTITDQQIRELRSAGLISAKLYRYATKGSPNFGHVTLASGKRVSERELYRALCAEILNTHKARRIEARACCAEFLNACTASKP